MISRGRIVLIGVLKNRPEKLEESGNGNSISKKRKSISKKKWRE